MRRNLLAGVVSLFVTVSACGGNQIDISDVPPLPPTSADEFEVILAGLDRPAVVNVWASWCLPCRSEAPLLREAHAQHSQHVEFIGVDVQDNQDDARAFIAEFDLPFSSYFDRGRAIPNRYGAIGTPITMFFTADGELSSIHPGVIDETGLALGIDELIRQGG